VECYVLVKWNKGIKRRSAKQGDKVSADWQENENDVGV